MTTPFMPTRTPLKAVLSTMNKHGIRAEQGNQGSSPEEKASLRSYEAVASRDYRVVFYQKDGINRVMYFRKDVQDLDSLALEVEILLERDHETQLKVGSPSPEQLKVV